MSHVIEDRLLDIHAAYRSIVAQAQQMGGMSAGERHAGDRTNVGLKEQHAISSPITILQENTRAREKGMNEKRISQLMLFLKAQLWSSSLNPMKKRAKKTHQLPQSNFPKFISRSHQQGAGTGVEGG